MITILQVQKTLNLFFELIVVISSFFFLSFSILCFGPSISFFKRKIGYLTLQYYRFGLGALFCLLIKKDVEKNLNLLIYNN
jgi:hypothetical protein